MFVFKDTTVQVMKIARLTTHVLQWVYVKKLPKLIAAMWKVVRQQRIVRPAILAKKEPVFRQQRHLQQLEPAHQIPIVHLTKSAVLVPV